MRNILLGSFLSLAIASGFITQIHAGGIGSMLSQALDGTLHKAVSQGNLVRLTYLLNQGADVNQREGGFPYETALMHAVRKRNTIMVQLLLAHGANVNRTDYYRRTALSLAVREHYPAAVQLLLEYGADVNITDSNGETALDEATKNSDIDAAKLLLQHGAKANNKALAYASARGCVAMIELLLMQGVDVNGYHAHDNKETALIMAAKNGRADAVLFLLKQGADKNYINSNGKDAWKLSSSLQCRQIIKSFQSGCDQIKGRQWPPCGLNEIAPLSDVASYITNFK